MAGHSHFQNIKYKKGRADAARGKIFSRLSKMITVCARDGGGDISTNSQLRLAIEKAKAANMPKDNIEKAVKKGTGEIKSERIESSNFEILGPDGSGFILEVLTDNKNRTISQVKIIANKNGLNFAGEGSVKWMFDHSGIIEIENIQTNQKEDIEINIIEAEADDFVWYENEEGSNNLNIYTKIESLEKVKKNIESLGLKIKDSKVGWKAKELIEIKDEKAVEKITKFLEQIEDNDDVSEVYFNFS